MPRERRGGGMHMVKIPRIPLIGAGMPGYMILSWVFIVVGLLYSLVVLVLQWRAWRRFKHVSFCLLLVSTVMAIADQALIAIPYVRLIEADALMVLMAVAAVPFAHAVVLGVWGTWSLFRAYERLEAENARLRAGLPAPTDISV
ncbi:MAG: hypothetical protein QM795_04130 [Pseudoxanthomonas sp.]